MKEIPAQLSVCICVHLWLNFRSQMKRTAREPALVFHNGTAVLPEVFRMASLTPAERAGVSREVGSLAPGKRADVLVLSRKLLVKQVFLGGEKIAA